MYAVTFEMKTSNRTSAHAQITASDHYSIRGERRIDNILNQTAYIYKTLLRPLAIVKRYRRVSSGHGVELYHDGGFRVRRFRILGMIFSCLILVVMTRPLLSFRKKCSNLFFFFFLLFLASENKGRQPNRVRGFPRRIRIARAIFFFSYELNERGFSRATGLGYDRPYAKNEI